MQKGEITIKILEKLQEAAEVGMGILDIACSGKTRGAYSNIYARSQRKNHIQTDWADNYRQRMKLYNLLGHLCREGLVHKTQKGGSSSWKLTKSGKDKLARLKQQHANWIYPLCPKDGKMRLVIFDIFEQEKRKRNWLRKILVNLGYKLLQKSVWQGERPLPEEFIKAINENGLMNYIHIFEVTKHGTLKKPE